MPTHPKPEHREGTNRSLREERARTDDAIEQRERRADALQAEHRARTDAATRAARDVTDARTTGADDATKAAMAAGRTAEDAALARERSAEDRATREDRLALRDLVARLFTAERAATDQHLAGERAWADQLIQLRFDYLAMVGHDLGSMLAAVKLESEFLHHALADAPAQDGPLAAARRIHRVTRRMQRLAADLVDVASLAHGTLRLLREEVDLTPDVADAVEEFEAEARARHVTLRLELPEEPLDTEADPDRIQQVLGNLLGNALKFTPAGGEVTVRAEVREDGLRLTVSDNGPGIPADKLELVFDRYVRLAPSGDRGVGLGLFIARSLIEAHGGRLWAESEHSRGCRFVFTLPRVRAAQTR